MFKEGSCKFSEKILIFKVPVKNCLCFTTINNMINQGNLSLWSVKKMQWSTYVYCTILSKSLQCLFNVLSVLSVSGWLLLGRCEQHELPGTDGTTVWLLTWRLPHLPTLCQRGIRLQHLSGRRVEMAKELSQMSSFPRNKHSPGSFCPVQCAVMGSGVHTYLS